jgi:2-oxoglutarate dehydrogenase E1 component
VLHDVKTGQRVSPIQQLPGRSRPMELHNSPLSEIACLGFEYGYSMEAPETLVLWEAQFGDFVNSAQVIVDQFIISALAKWGQTTRLTLLLPARLRGLRPRAQLGAARALPLARRRGQHARGEPDHAGPVLPPAAPPGAGRQAAAR